MSTIYIIGHKNPDTDSIASATAYAKLKNAIDPQNTYIAARSGNINNQTKYIFDTNDEKVPFRLKDVYTKVEDIMTTQVLTVNENDSVKTAFSLVEGGSVRTIPVVDENNIFKGIIGSPQLLQFFVQDNIEAKPKYVFDAEHIASVINGEILHKGKNKEFKASILAGAMPAVKATERLSMEGFKETILVVGARKRIVEYAIKKNLSAIIITGDIEEQFDFSGFDGWVFHSSMDTAETIRRVVLASPAKSIMSSSIETLNKSDYLDAAKDKLTSSELRALPVVDNGKLVGIVTKSNILKKFKYKLILVDHNESDQAVDGIENADIVEIIDHHRLGTIKTSSPVTFYAKPVGSTCTLVYQLYKANNITPDIKTAMILMGGILSDTVMLKSPTVTEEDKEALKELEKISGKDAKEYGLAIFSATDNLSARTPKNIVETDFKMYEEYGVSFGVGQVEVVSFSDFEEVKESLLKELENQKKEHNLDWAMLMITDIIKEDSVLLTTKFEAGEKLFSYRSTEEHLFNMPGVLSRKKQLLPEVLRIVEELAN